jgi:hypothetical protein
MTPPELAVALRKLAAKAATTDGLKLLDLANSFDRPAHTSTQRRHVRVVEFRVNGKGYRTRSPKERLGGFSLA